MKTTRIPGYGPGKKVKGAGLGWGPGGLDCSDYPDPDYESWQPKRKGK